MEILCYFVPENSTDVGLFRQLVKPLYKYLREPEYRAYLRVKKACRNKPAQSITIWLDGYVVEGNDGPSLLHQYEEIVLRRSFDFDAGTDTPVIYSCGANIGLEVLHFESIYPAAKIKAFEADPQLFSVLKSNIERNEARAEVFHAALHTSNGTVQFAPDGKLGGKVGSGSVTVNAIRLRDLLAAENTVDLLILDVEGAENEILPDCADQLNKVKRLFVEWHGDQNKPQNLQAILSLLTEKGFRYRLNNNLGTAPFRNTEPESGFDAMVEIYATRTS